MARGRLPAAGHPSHFRLLASRLAGPVGVEDAESVKARVRRPESTPRMEAMDPGSTHVHVLSGMSASCAQLTLILRGALSARFGIETSSTPFLPLAWMPSALALSGSAKRR